MLDDRAEREKEKIRKNKGKRCGSNLGKKLTSQKGRYQTPPGIQLLTIRPGCRGQSSGFIGVFGTWSRIDEERHYYQYIPSFSTLAS